MRWKLWVYSMVGSGGGFRSLPAVLKISKKKKSVNIGLLKYLWFPFSKDPYPVFFNGKQSPLVQDRSDKWIHLRHITTQPAKKKWLLQVNLCQNLLFLHNIGRTCVYKLFWMSKSISVHDMFSPCSELGIFTNWTCNSTNT